MTHSISWTNNLLSCKYLGNKTKLQNYMCWLLTVTAIHIFLAKASPSSSTSILSFVRSSFSHSFFRSLLPSDHLSFSGSSDSKKPYQKFRPPSSLPRSLPISLNVSSFGASAVAKEVPSSSPLPGPRPLFLSYCWFCCSPVAMKGRLCSYRSVTLST